MSVIGSGRRSNNSIKVSICGSHGSRSEIAINASLAASWLRRVSGARWGLVQLGPDGLRIPRKVTIVETVSIAESLVRKLSTA